MNDPITALGIVCIVSAIIGGGFSAAGYTIPGIKDWWRQLLLGVFGVVLISSAHLEWLRYMADPFNRGKKPIRSLVVAPNQGENTWVTAGSSGSIYIRMYETVPPRDDKKEPYGLRVTICPPYTVAECPSRQMADGDIFRVDAPVEGRYRVDIQNFSINPPLTVNAEIRYPK